MVWPLAAMAGEPGPCDVWLDELTAWIRARAGRQALALSCCGGPPLALALVEGPVPLAAGVSVLHLERCWLVEPGRPGTVTRALLAALARHADGLGADGLRVGARTGLDGAVLAAAGCVPQADGWLLAVPRTER